MAKKDIETIIDDIKAYLVANLNTKLTEIDTEKGDFSLAAVDTTNGYVLLTLDLEAVNVDPFVFIGIERIRTNGIGPASSQDISINIILTLGDHGNDNFYIRRLFRYQRALMEVLQKGWAKISRSDKLELTNIEPIAYQLANSSTWYRAIGVQISTTIFT